MKNQGKLSWLFAALVALGITFAFEPLLAASTRECSQSCSGVSKIQYKQKEAHVDWFLQNPKELACKKEIASYEYQDWFDWKPQWSHLTETQMASNGSDKINWQPARSNN